MSDTRRQAAADCAAQKTEGRVAAAFSEQQDEEPRDDGILWSDEELRQYDELRSETYARYGHESATRAQAAAHEAGHVVVGHSLGFVVEGACLVPYEGGLWGGLTPIDFDQSATRIQLGAFAEACLRFAGFAGEVFAGIEHPSSSLDERFVAGALADRIATRMGAGHLAVRAVVAGHCWHVLRTEEVTFHAVRRMLLYAGHLTHSTIQRILSRGRSGRTS